MSATDRWKHVALILEARDAGVDIDVIEAQPDWADQARSRHGSRARDLVDVFDFLLTDANRRAADPQPLDAAADSYQGRALGPGAETYDAEILMRLGLTLIWDSRRGTHCWTIPGTSWDIGPSGDWEQPWLYFHPVTGTRFASSLEGALRGMVGASTPPESREWTKVQALLDRVVPRRA